jgi:hypothetical protein
MVWLRSDLEKFTYVMGTQKERATNTIFVTH